MSGLAAVQFLEQPCRTALNRVSNMSFKWSQPEQLGFAGWGA